MLCEGQKYLIRNNLKDTEGKHSAYEEKKKNKQQKQKQQPLFLSLCLKNRRKTTALAMGK